MPPLTLTAGSEVKLNAISKVFLKKKKFSEEHLEECAAYFDIDFYRNVSGSNGLTSRNGLLHYLREGWKQGLDPSSRFSTNDYLALYPDIAEAEVNPLLHFVLHGQFENRVMRRADTEFVGAIEKLSLTSLQARVVDKLNPGLVVPLQLSINGKPFAKVSNDRPRPDLARAGLSHGAGGVEMAIPFDKLEPGVYEVGLDLPDGQRLVRTIEVPARAPTSSRPLPPMPDDPDATKVVVVVPIYNAYEDVEVCIERLQTFTPNYVDIILIDDCSTDPAITSLLDTVRQQANFKVLHNEQNLGFTRTINRGLTQAGDADVIILNSDARVTPRWIEGMFCAAHSRKNVATVTAMSDRAGAFSAPNIGNENPLPAGVREEDFARAFRRRSLRLYPEVPTGNGFCMYIRRAALNALGHLDEEAFPRGYGEENDFCMRALRAGWANLVDDSTYVFHDRSKSFGESKNENMARGRKVVDERYPEYKRLIGKYRTGVEMNMARYRAWLALEDCVNGRAVLPRALFVLATRTGGTPQTNADLMGALDDSFECLVLNCDALNLELSRVVDGELEPLRTHRLTERIEPLQHRSNEYDEVVGHWLHELDLDLVHIRHLGWHSLTLPRLAKRSGARVVMSFHDFYSLCPSLKLLDDQNVFCGGTCTAGNGLCKVELWPRDSVPPLKNAWVHYWRNRMEDALAPCDQYVTTSQSAAERILRSFPSIESERLHVIPHGRNFNRFTSQQHLPDGHGPIRILVPGNIDKAKGLDLLAGILKEDRLQQFEFHILGNVNKSALSGKIPSRMHLHGSYDRHEFAKKVSNIAPAIGVVLSIWDETYCHTLTEMWSVGLPVAVLDFPTLRNRVTESGAGWVLEDMEVDALLRALTQITADPEQLREKGAAAARWQMHRGAAQSTRQMAANYLDVYRGNEAGDHSPKIGVLCPAGAELRTAYPSTEIRIWERTRNRLDRPIDYMRTKAPGLLAKMKMGMVDGAVVRRNAIPA